MIMSNTHQLQAITARKKTMEADTLEQKEESAEPTQMPLECKGREESAAVRVHSAAAVSLA
jgi:hypothetical protein